MARFGAQAQLGEKARAGHRDSDRDGGLLRAPADRVDARPRVIQPWQIMTPEAQYRLLMSISERKRAANGCSRQRFIR